MSKELLEQQHSAQMNQEAVERIKKDSVTSAQAEAVEKIFFEDDETIKLRDGKIYRIPPANLKNARKMMKLLKTINADVIILNFIPSGNPELDEQREKDFYEVLSIAFTNYPDIRDDRDYLDEYVDVEIARRIIDILIGLNGIKK